MTFFRARSGLVCSATAMMLLGACSSPETTPSVTSVSGGATGAAGSAGSPGSSGSTASDSSGVSSGVGGGSGQSSSTGTAGAGVSGGTGSGSATAASGSNAGTGSGSGTSGAAAGGSGSSGPDGGTTNPDAGGNYAPAPRPINVTPGGVFSMSYMGQPMYLDQSKTIQGKLVLFLGGICTGVGGGGFESFVQEYGFHTFSPKTDTCLDGGKVPQMYKTTLMTNPNDPEANRQIGDSRMELWDGVTRVNWYSVAPGASIVAETVAAIKFAVSMGDQGGDWGYFLDSTGNGLRTSDVWVVGYSWGSQTWAMISAYVPFGRVITTSGPQDEGFPNALWITQPGPNATPGDLKYMLVGFTSPYPSAYAADSEVMSMVTTVTKAGWIGTPTNVLPNGMGTYMAPEHLFAMVGGNGGTSPGGHTVFCNNNPMNGWLPLCKYVLGQ
jgi:hypothetical protein